ncbi:MAG: hypothetical protein KDA27_26345 [Candidatus Eisenbacteria bacterium]|uniref:Uncharacterized protein n=1 Tax=Eiseniibacteriota bacterium TaxID=2212470 RepID=A0A956NIE7_UNCEI|nr:hypothetical protein [Candidatus Eisenbacteria bacterium]
MLRLRLRPSASAFVYLCLLSVGLLATPTLAGPNAGGTLIVHGDPNVEYTSDIDDYSGFAELPGGCESAITNYPSDETFVWWVKAAFPEDATPRLAAAVFGIDYDEDAVILIAHGPSGDFELPDPSWPAPQSGTAVAFAQARTESLVDLYWFAGYNYSLDGADVSFDLVPSPSQGAEFADDLVPANLDPVVGLGKLGFGNKFGELPCPEPIGDGVGACCDGVGNCSISSPGECAERDGTYMGHGTDCEPSTCGGQEDYGACCRSDGTCDITLRTGCTQGVWHEGVPCNPSPCPPPERACCFEDVSCLLLLEEDCALQGGLWFAEERECSPNPCPSLIPGACCLDNGDCLITNATECRIDIDGAWQGVGTECEPNPCSTPLGACCLIDDSCIVTIANDCTDGEWLGPDTVCEPNPCVILGACCNVDGSCSVVSQAECGSGEWQGANTDCDPDPCGEEGACCLDGGECVVTDFAGCYGQVGAWQGGGTVCDPNPCPQPTGACCFPGGNHCSIRTEESCLQNPGYYYVGDDTVCEPNPCPDVLGACCFEDDICEVLSVQDCDVANGVYVGRGTECDPNPCSVVPVLEESWGTLKSKYR